MIRALFAIALLPSVALAEPATVRSVIDGDTVSVILAGQRVLVRIAGIDSPELSRAKCARERQLGEAARRAASELLPVGAVVDVIPTGARDRYNRLIARIEIGGVDFGKAMLGKGLAVGYQGRGARQDWCK